jgi:hypothetical protein
VVVLFGKHPHDVERLVEVPSMAITRPAINA